MTVDLPSRGVVRAVIRRPRHRGRGEERRQLLQHERPCGAGNVLPDPCLDGVDVRRDVRSSVDRRRDRQDGEGCNDERLPLHTAGIGTAFRRVDPATECCCCD
jgi:hypothetical protein